MRPSFRLRVWAVLCFACALPAALLSQTTTGRILGEIHDQTGAAVAGASVTVSDVQRGASRTVATDSSGNYVVATLPPGVYRVHAEAKGFKTVERPNVQVEVASDVAVDFSLPPGNVAETVVVSGDVPLVNTTSSSLGGTLSNKEIVELPLNGRNYENLLQLRPGVIRYPGGGFSTTSSNGLRAEDNAYLVDGLFNSEPFSGQSIINGAGIAGDSATILPVDSIQEFNLEQNPAAEYGWKPGSIVNVGLKSGSNQMHGSAYAFGRDTPFDARNYFNPTPQEKNPRNLEQFGGTLGGAIIKDKLFYFGGYEGQRYTVGNTGSLQTFSTVPLPTVAAGNAGFCLFTQSGDCQNSIPDAIANVHAGFLAGQLPSDVSAASLKIAGCSFAPPNTVSCDGSGFPLNSSTIGGSSINFGLPNTVSSDNGVAKVDYRLSPQNVFSTMYFFGNNSGTVSDASQLQTKWLTLIHTRAQVLGENWTFVPNAHWVNEARFGYNRLYQPTFVNDHNTNIQTQYGLNTGVTNPLYGGLPRISVWPYYIFPQELGGFNWPKIQGPDTRFQFVDHVSYVTGKNAIKFGGELHRDAFSGGAYGGARGRIKFIGGSAYAAGAGSSGLEDFFAGLPTVGQLLVGDPTRHIHNWGFASFVQDDFRLTRNLTLNLGLRYEVNSVIKEEHNLLGNFDPNKGLVQVGHNGISGPYNPDRNNFAPRLGFAWDIDGSGRTVLRGGAGIIYETVNWEAFLALNNSLGLATVPTGAQINSSGATSGGNISAAVGTFDGSSLNWNGTVFPGNNVVNCDPVTGSPCNILGVDQNLKTPYVANWNLGVEHSFTANLVLDVAYVGNHGAQLVGIRDINQVDPTSPAEIACGHCEQAGRPLAGKFPYLGQIYQMGNIYRSNYNGLQATLTSRNFHGLTMVAGYTYSHALDDVGANWDFGAGLGLPSDSTHPGREYASSDFDMRHRFTLSTTYLLPSREGFAQLLKGWQLNSIISLYAAQPYGVMDAGTDVSLTGEANDRWNFYGNPSDFKSTPVGIPYFAFGDPGMPAACLTQAAAIGAMDSLAAFGCYANGNSVMIPPAFGTFGTAGRNIFRDTGFKNVDLSVAKNFKFGERLGAQFRVEFFNIFNHPNFANPFGGQNGFAHNDPSTQSFGCGCATPDVAAANPVIGSGGSRAMQLGLKLSF
jgi:Carboxypeptidase regulatory-like domain